MSLSKAFKTHMTTLTASIAESANINETTNTIGFSLEKVDMPKGITDESLQLHVGFINEVTGALEVATADTARDMFAKNDKLTTVDSTLAVCNGLTLRSQHHLKQSLGNDTYLYGESTTVVDFVGSEDQAKWLTETREHNKALAKALFS